MVKTFDCSLSGFAEEKCIDSENDDKSNEESSDTIINDSGLPKHFRCYAHNLQLVVRDGLKEAGQHLKTVVAMAANIVNFVWKSVNANKILEGAKKLQASNATRWNSQLYMINQS